MSWVAVLQWLILMTWGTILIGFLIQQGRGK